MDDIKAIRDALAAGPKPGEWAPGNTCPLLFGVRHGCGTEPIGFVYGPARAEASDYGRQCLATAAYIAACHPERIARLLDALELAQKDAARYRWLRDALGDARKVSVWFCSVRTSAELDAAIDAAMSAAPQSPEGLK